MKNAKRDLEAIAMCICAIPFAMTALPYWVAGPLIVYALFADVWPETGGEV